jgi:hypothetical protein
MKEYIEPVADVFNGIIGVIDQAVTDTDLKAKLIHGISVKQMDMTQALITSANTPGYVKFFAAMRDFVLPVMREMVSWMRPIGSAALTFAGVYMHVKGIEIDPKFHMIIDSAFPGWMAAREVGKSRDSKERVEISKTSAISKKYNVFPWHD